MIHPRYSGGSEIFNRMLSSPKEVKRRFSVTDTIAPEMKREKEKILYIRDMIDREEKGKAKKEEMEAESERERSTLG